MESIDFKSSKALEELILFFKSLVSIDENYAKNLQNLSNFQFLSLSGSLHEAGISLKHDITNKIIQVRAFIDNIVQDIIKPLQDILNSTIDQIKNLSNQIQKLMTLKEKYYKLYLYK